MSYSITINISDTLYEQLNQAAQQFHQPAEVIILDSLRHTLPPLFEDIPAEYQSDVFPLLTMGDEELLEESRRRFSPDQWQQYEFLLEQKKISDLSAAAEQKLQDLKRQADVLVFRRGYAAVLLKRRGYSPAIPSSESQEA